MLRLGEEDEKPEYLNGLIEETNSNDMCYLEDNPGYSHGTGTAKRKKIGELEVTPKTEDFSGQLKIIQPVAELEEPSFQLSQHNTLANNVYEEFVSRGFPFKNDDTHPEVKIEPDDEMMEYGIEGPSHGNGDDSDEGEDEFNPKLPYECPRVYCNKRTTGQNVRTPTTKSATAYIVEGSSVRSGNAIASRKRVQQDGEIVGDDTFYGAPNSKRAASIDQNPREKGSASWNKPSKSTEKVQKTVMSERGVNLLILADKFLLEDGGFIARPYSDVKDGARKYLKRWVPIDVDIANEKAAEHAGTELGEVWKYVAGQSLYINEELSRCHNIATSNSAPESSGIIVQRFDYDKVVVSPPIECEIPNRAIRNLAYYLCPIKCAEVSGQTSVAATSLIANQILHQLFDNDPVAPTLSGANKTSSYGKYEFVGFPLQNGICELLTRGFCLDAEDLDESFRIKERNRMMRQVSKVTTYYFDRVRQRQRKKPNQSGSAVHDATPEEDLEDF